MGNLKEKIVSKLLILLRYASSSILRLCYSYDSIQSSISNNTALKNYLLLNYHTIVFSYTFPSTPTFVISLALLEILFYYIYLLKSHSIKW